MAIVGRGRIVVWEGASLWLLAGGQEPAVLRPHAHHAIQITFGLEGSFEIGVAGERLGGPVAAIASDASHTFRASGAVAFLFIAPESPVGRAIGAKLFAGRPWASVRGVAAEASLDELRQCLRDGCDEDEMRRLGRKVMAALPAAAQPALADPRVLAMIDVAHRRLEDGVSLPQAAGSVHLSPGRARHLFVEHTGLPFKTYVLWLRLQRAVGLYAAGRSLTEAAHQSGFSDSAHLSRTFRRTFGLPAAALSLSSAAGQAGR
ncbi:AraC family transcriptional regulator [uncultured Piscinibacter sp.]|uniref:helix-turn-helix transcriptional regulator n=1 Tax=uncultured Piscinibacter sp. TaxID=1131835 RepID=UPI002623F353|nr:AraC family transcriptional regulator [uncultured Piscinibacter sp.]